MFFNSLTFVWIFLPGVLLGYFFIIPRHWRREYLLAASFIFYAASGPAYLLLLIGDLAWVYSVTRMPNFVQSKWRLVLAIALPLLALVYFKYLNFVLVDALGIPPTILEDTIFARVLLPIGISFFTFELISYSIDRYRGQIEPQASLVNFSLFVSFFPHLVAGPILRFGDVAAQFTNLPRFKLRVGEAQQALIQITVGYAVKILLADWLASYVGLLKEHLGSLTGPAAFFLIFGFSLQIYFDFFGYSLIAIGLGRLVGVRLPDNFRRPYEALNPRDFWRRWHISLSFWLRDYIYLPLGGNTRYIRNIAVVFLACGVWHGAGWNFAAWGLLHALFVVCYHMGAKQWDQMPEVLQRGVTFILVSFAWLPFIFDLDNTLKVLRSLTVWKSSDLLPTDAWFALLLSAIACVAADVDRIQGWLARRPANQRIGGVIAGVLLFASLLFFDRTASFIYFRF